MTSRDTASKALAGTLLGVAIAFLSASGVPAQGGPSIVAEEPVHDIGIVEAGTDVVHTFVLRNEGDAPLELIEVEPDCGCTVVSYDRRIAPGRTGKVTARIDISTFVGPIAKYLVVHTNDSATPQLSLAIKVEVRPLLQAHPGYARFLTVVGEGAEPVDQVVWASDIEDLELRNVRSPYRFVSVAAREAKEGEERSEGQGRQWVIEVKLADNAPIGPMAGHIEFETNHPSRPNMRIPVSGFVRPILAATPPFADFGPRELTAPIRASVEIKNFSEEEISLTEVVSTIPQLETEIQVDGDDYYVIMILNPGLPAGAFSGTVTVTTTSRRVPSLEIEVRGTVL